MKKTSAMVAVFATASFALVCLVLVPRQPRLNRTEPTSAQAAPQYPGAGWGLKARHRALHERYERNAHKLDCLANDTAVVPNEEKAIFARVLHDARTRRDHTQSALELLGHADTSDPAAWEIKRAMAQDSLDSLENYLNLTQNGSWRPSAK